MSLTLPPAANRQRARNSESTDPTSSRFYGQVADAPSILDALPYDLLFSDGLLPGGTGLKITAKANGKNVNLILSFKALATADNATP